MTRVNTQSRFIEMFGRIDSKKRLGDVASYINGFAFKPSDWTTSGLPIIRIQNLTGSNELFNYYSGNYPAQVEVNNGDILISWSATLGVFVWAQGKALLNQHIFKVSFDKGYVNRDYFIYAVTQKLDEMAAKTHGTTMRHIVKSDFDNTVIPFPDETEQDRFATFANQADKSKFNGFKSRFIEMFDSRSESFKKYPIADLCHSNNDIKCGPFGTQLKQAEYTDYGVPVWGIPQINSGFTLAPDVFVSEEKAKQLEQFSLVSEDIAMSRKGNVGQCAMCPDSFENGIIASDVVRIRVNKEKILPRFLVYQLHNSPQIRKQILEVSDGTVMAGINVTKMKGIIVYCPHIGSQQTFSVLLEQADKSKYLS